MKDKKLFWAKTVFVGVVLASIHLAPAQSVDTLIEKLIDKGILTMDEAKELREEADKDFTRAYAAKSGLPEWVTSLKLHGDFRGRYEMFDGGNEDFVTRNRFRYRARVGVTAVMFENFEAGLRLTSSDAVDSFGGDPISGNTSMQNNGSKKFIYFDLAYGKWTALNNEAVRTDLTIGKMENPFVFSDMVFDRDYTPEGAAAQFTLHLNHDPLRAQALKLNAGAFLLDEIDVSSHDPYFLGVQLRWDGIWRDKETPAGWTASAGVAFLSLQSAENLTSSAVGDVNAGNTREPLVGGAITNTGSVLRYSYNPIVADASLTYTLEQFWMYNAPFPITLEGDYIYNPAVDTANQAYSVGVTFGKAGKRRLWEVGYRWKYLEGDAWYEEVVDSDYGAYYAANSSRGRKGYRAGTNVRGHVIRAAYSPAAPLTLATTLFLTELIDEAGVAAGADRDSRMLRLQVDANLKF